MGDEAGLVLSSTNISEEDRKKYDTVIARLEDFFQVRCNVIYERVRFNRHNQREGESAEQYIMVLYDLVETCDYGILKDEMLCDRLVVGIADAALSKNCSWTRK